MVHRDIKPGNMLLDRAGSIKILDLGLARVFHDEASPTVNQHEQRNVLGTADYVAPEQAIDSSAVDIRGDIYSLGVTFYFLLTARSPYSDGSVSQKLLQHQMSAPTPVNEHRTEVPWRLAAVLEQMMAKDPAERFQAPAELYQALAPWDEGAKLPPDQEMPQLSPAARASGSGHRLPKVVANGLATTQPASAWVRWKARLGIGDSRNPRLQAVVVAGVVTLAAVCGVAAAVLAGH
jgi:serine/threonine protein kinase